MSAMGPDYDSDEILMLQVEQGSKEAFNQVFAKYWESAYTIAYKRLKDDDQAKDIVQEIFTHIWLKRGTIHISNVPAYLNRAIRNRIFKIALKEKTAHHFFYYLQHSREKTPGADSQFLFKEFHMAYERLVNSLPAQRQLIFRLRFQDDLATKDIADIMGLSRKTVQNQLARAVEKLKVSLSHLLTIPLFILLTFF